MGRNEKTRIGFNLGGGVNMRRICDIEEEGLMNGIRLSFFWMFIYSIAFLFDSDGAQMLYPEQLRIIDAGLLVLYFPYVMIFHRRREVYIKENFVLTGMNLFSVGWIKLFMLATVHGGVSFLKSLTGREPITDSLLIGGKDFIVQITGRIMKINLEFVLVIFVFSFTFFFFTYVRPSFRTDLEKILKRIEERKKRKEEEREERNRRKKQSASI
jgi:hypothetical protein